MTTARSKLSKTKDAIEPLRRKSSEYLFRPIASSNDLISQRKPPSPFQTGLRYLKFLGQIKRQNEHLESDVQQIKSPILERTSAFLTNYYAPLPPLSSHLTNKSIQVDDFDDLSYKTAVNDHRLPSYLSFYECCVVCLSILFFISIVLFMQFHAQPIHCLFHQKFWHPMDMSDGFLCENTNIEIHYVEIDSLIYQIEMQRNIQAMNCLGLEILSCLPIDYLSVPRGRIIRRNNQLMNYCNHTRTSPRKNHSLSILPGEQKWNLRNHDADELLHCSCVTNFEKKKCFHLMITDQCDLQIPWFEYCLKYSTTHLTCQAYVHASK